jgi:hypothetical protein
MMWAALILVSSAACQAKSCDSRPQHLEFEELRLADRLDVIGLGNNRIATIGDKAKIQDAVAFIERHQDGWIEVWTGSLVPVLDIQFYQGTRHLGEFGISSDNITVGGLSQETPAAEIAALAKRLDLQWPSLR